jgi:hypothetical protein
MPIGENTAKTEVVKPRVEIFGCLLSRQPLHIRSAQGGTSGPGCQGCPAGDANGQDR